MARIDCGRVVTLDAPVIFDTDAHASLPLAWQAFARQLRRPLPRAAVIAFAGPIEGEVLKLTNSAWMIRPATLAGELGIDRCLVLNDFGAVAHAVAHVGAEYLRPLCGPDRPLPTAGAISIVGPGTGLGVAILLRSEGHYHVQEAEGGHADFAPLDSLEDALVARLRPLHRRVSVERIVSGPGLQAIHSVLAQIEARSAPPMDDAALWKLAMAGGDTLAAAALDRFCMSLGAVAGDMALAHGAAAVVIAGGIGLRLADRLPRSGFAARFVAKGRFETRMTALPVKVLTHPEPGLLGAAAALAREHGG